MRIKSPINDIKPDCPGKVTIICDCPEDLWHIYNIVSKGDFIRTKTFRKVAHENSQGVKTNAVKKKIDITIKIEEIEYDNKEGLMRFKGKNVSENDFISVGQYQSIEIGKGSLFTLIKKLWDEIHIEKLRLGSDPSISSDLAAVLMEEGICHVYLISSHITTLKAKVEMSISKKRKGPSQHDKTLTNFFQKILDAITTNINFEIVKCIVVASPGFTKDQFGDFLANNTSNNKHYEIIRKNLNKFVYVHSSTGYKQAIQEILAKPEILTQIKNTKASDDILVMENLNNVLAKDMERVVFGMKSILIAYEKDAIETLIVSDDFLRKINPSVRKEVTTIMRGLKEKNREVVKMSSMHYTGEKINSFGGIIAILKYALEELNEVEEDINSTDVFEEQQINEELEAEDRLALMLDDCNLEEEEKDEVEDLPGNGKNDDSDDLSPFKNKHGNKSKPSKFELKERDQGRKIAARKKSSFDEEI